jgi:hypothetical protein
MKRNKGGEASPMVGSIHVYSDGYGKLFKHSIKRIIENDVEFDRIWRTSSN